MINGDNAKSLPEVNGKTKKSLANIFSLVIDAKANANDLLRFKVRLKTANGIQELEGSVLVASSLKITNTLEYEKEFKWKKSQSILVKLQNLSSFDLKGPIKVQLSTTVAGVELNTSEAQTQALKRNGTEDVRLEYQISDKNLRGTDVPFNIKIIYTPENRIIEQMSFSTRPF